MMDGYHIKYRIAERKYRQGEWDSLTVRATTKYSARMKILDHLADLNLVPSKIFVSLNTSENGMERTTGHQ